MPEELSNRISAGDALSRSAPGADTGLSDDESALFGKLSRRHFLTVMSAAGAGLLARQLSAQQETLKAAAALGDQAVRSAATDALQSVPVELRINGALQRLTVDPRMTLLDALRERLALTGSKKGCDHGQCGACTVIVDRKRVLSCLTLAAQADGRSVTTVEGLASGDHLHPMQEAFIEHDSFQCGYCTPGQLCSAVALLDEARRGEASHVTLDLLAPPTTLSDDEIRERMSGNLCRCAAYPQILAAIRQVHAGRATAQTWRFVDGEKLAAVRKEFAHDTV